MAKPGIPLSVELATGWKALALIRHELGITQTASVLSSMIGAMRSGEPFGHLPPPVDRCEALSRKQIAPAILLYRALIERLEHPEAFELVRQVAVEGARVFLKRMVGLLDQERIEQMSEGDRETFVADIGERFFNAKLEFDEISVEAVRFTVTACCFPTLFRQAGTPELAPLLCEGDEVFFGQDVNGVELERPSTIADGATTCSFHLKWHKP